MRFYGNGVVWDRDNGKALCRFSKAGLHEKGTLDTDDARVIAELVRMGFKSDEAVDVTPLEPTKPPVTERPEITVELGVAKLRELGREAGLTFPVGTKMTDMVEAIKNKREA